MYEKLLVAVDSSAAAERVIDAARDMALLSNGEVWVLHLLEKEFVGLAGFFPVESETEARSVVERAAQILDDAGVKTHYEVLSTISGQAAREIAAAARAHDADIIVMGSRGHSDLTSLVLGSTAHKVIHLSDRPVLVVR